MPVDSILATVAVLAVFVGLLAALWLMKRRGVEEFTPRVFTALGLGIALGVGIQLALGRGSDAALWALDWIAVVGQGYIALLKMLVMPLVFVAIVGAFTRTKVTENLGRISVVVLAVLLGTVAVAALVGLGGRRRSPGLPAPASPPTRDRTRAAASRRKRPPRQRATGGRTSRCHRKSFRSSRSNVFADFAGSALHVHHRRRYLLRHRRRGLPAARMRRRRGRLSPAATAAACDQADFFQQLVDSLYGIVMRIVAMVLAPRALWRAGAHRARHGLERLRARCSTWANSWLVSYAAHRVHVRRALHWCCWRTVRARSRYANKAFPVLSFAFVARSSAGALPLNIETQTNALGVDEATANFAASFGMSIGQNGCAGIYPAMLATIIAPTVGIDVFSPTFVAGLVAVVVISSFGVAGVGGGATFASLIVLGTMGLPIEIVGLLASVEPLIDMGRTALNVSDSMVAGVTASNAAGALDG